MREMYRKMAKAKMKKLGYSKPNKRMRLGKWRQLVSAYPIRMDNGKPMELGWHGKKRYETGHRGHLFAY